MDSPLREPLIGDLCLGSFPFLVEAMGSGLFFLWSSSTKDATVSLRDSMDYCWTCIAEDYSCWTPDCLASYQTNSSGVLAMSEFASLSHKEDEDPESVIAERERDTPTPQASTE